MFRRDFVMSLACSLVAFVAGLFSRPRRIVFGQGKPYEKNLTLIGGEKTLFICDEDAQTITEAPDGDVIGLDPKRHVTQLGPLDRVIRWIPVTERLPNLKMRISDHCAEWHGPGYAALPVNVVIGQYVHVAYRILRFDTGNEFWAWDTDGKEKICDGLVTHWAKLPVPPDAERWPRFTSRTTERTVLQGRPDGTIINLTEDGSIRL